MSWRRGGRNLFAPAWLLWGPATAVGLVVLGLRVSARDVGREAFVVRVTFGHPAQWFQDMGTGILGVTLLLVGTLAWVVAQMRLDDGEWPLQVRRYGPFAAAAWLLALGAVLASWLVDGHVLDAGAGGITWRFVATYRSAPADVVTTWVLGVLALVFWLLSVGRPRRFLPPTPPISPEQPRSGSTVWEV